MSSVESFPYFDFSQTHWGVRKFLYGERLMLTVRQYEKPPAASPGWCCWHKDSIWAGLLPNFLQSMSKPAGGNHSSPLSVTFHIARPQKHHFNYWGLWKSPMDLNSSKNLKSAFPGCPNFSAKFLGDSLGIGYIKSANSQWTFSTCKSCYFLLFHALSNYFSLFTR